MRERKNKYADGGWVVATERNAKPDENGMVKIEWAAKTGPAEPPEYDSEDYAFLLTNVRDAVGDDE